MPAKQSVMQIGHFVIQLLPIFLSHSTAVASLDLNRRLNQISNTLSVYFNFKFPFIRQEDIMPISNPMDDNIFQSAEWTRPSPPGHRYQFLGGVSFLKPQNPTYIDETNRNLGTRAIDRRVANPQPDMFEVTPSPDDQTDQSGASSKAGPAAVTSEPKRRHRQHKRRSCRDDQFDDQETFTVCPDRPSVSTFFGDFTSEMGGTCRELSLAISKGKGEGSMVDRISDVVYQRKRPFYLGLILLVVLLIIIALLASCGSCKPTKK